MLQPPKLKGSVASLQQEIDEFFKSKIEPIVPERVEPQNVQADYLRFPVSQEKMKVGKPNDPQYSDAFFSYLLKNFDASYSLVRTLSSSDIPTTIPKDLYSPAQVLTVYCQYIPMLYASINSMFDKGFLKSTERPINDADVNDMIQILFNFEKWRKDGLFPVFNNELIKLENNIMCMSTTGIAASDDNLYVLTEINAIKVIPLSSKYGKRPERTIMLQGHVQDNSSLVFINDVLIIVSDKSARVIEPITGDMIILQKTPPKFKPNTVTDGKYLYSIDKEKSSVHVFEYANGIITEKYSVRIDLSFLEKGSLFSLHTNGVTMIITYHSQNSVIHTAFSLFDGSRLYEKTIANLPFGTWVPVPYSNKLLYIEDRTIKIFRSKIPPRWLIGITRPSRHNIKNTLSVLWLQAYLGHPLFVGSPIDTLKDIIANLQSKKNIIGLSVIIKYLGEQRFEVSQAFYEQLLNSPIPSLLEQILASAMESMTRAAGGAVLMSKILSRIIEAHAPLDVIWLHHSVLTSVFLSEKAKTLVIQSALKKWPFMGDKVYEILGNFLPLCIDDIVSHILKKFHQNIYNLDEFFNSTYHLLYLRILQNREWWKPSYFAIKITDTVTRTDKLDIFLARVYSCYLTLDKPVEGSFDFIQTDRMFVEYLRHIYRPRNHVDPSTILYLQICPIEFKLYGGDITRIPTEIAELYSDRVKQAADGMDHGLQKIYDFFTKALLPNPKEVDILRHASFFLSIFPKLFISSQNIHQLVKFCQLGDFVSTFDILKGVNESNVISHTFIRRLMQIAGKHLGWGLDRIYRWPIEDLQGLMTTLAIISFLRKALVRDEYADLYSVKCELCQVALLAAIGDGIEWDIPSELQNGNGRLEKRLKQSLSSKFDIESVSDPFSLISAIKSINVTGMRKVYKTAALERISRSIYWEKVQDIKIKVHIFERCKMPVSAIGTYSNQPFAFLSRSPVMTYPETNKQASNTLCPLADETVYVSSPIFPKSRSTLKIEAVKGSCTLSLVALCGLTGERLSTDAIEIKSNTRIQVDVDPSSLSVVFTIADRKQSYRLSTSFHTLYYTLNVPVRSIIKYKFTWSDSMPKDRITMSKAKKMFSYNFTIHVPYTGWGVFDKQVALFTSKRVQKDLYSRMSTQLALRNKLTTNNVFSLFYFKNPDPFSLDLTVPEPEIYQGMISDQILPDFLTLFVNYSSPISSLYSNVRIAGSESAEPQNVVIQNSLVITPKSPVPIKKIGKEPKNVCLRSLSYIIPMDRPFGTAVMLPLAIRIALSVSLLTKFSFIQTIKMRMDKILSQEWQKSLTADISHLIRVISPSKLFENNFDIPSPESFFTKQSIYFTSPELFIPYYAKVNGSKKSGKFEFPSNKRVFIGALKATEIITGKASKTLSEGKWMISESNTTVISDEVLLCNVPSSIELQQIMYNWRPIWSKELLSSFKNLEELSKGYKNTFVSATVSTGIAKMVMSLLLRMPDQQPSEPIDSFVCMCVRNPWHFFDVAKDVPKEFTWLTDFLCKLSPISSHIFHKYLTDQWTIKYTRLVDFQASITFTDTPGEIINVPSERKLIIGKFEGVDLFIKALKTSIDAQIN